MLKDSGLYCCLRSHSNGMVKSKKDRQYNRYRKRQKDKQWSTRL